MAKIMTIRPPEELHQKLKVLAKEREFTVNGVVLEILWAYTEKKDREERGRRRELLEKTLYDIKNRLFFVSKKQTECIEEMGRRGLATDPAEFSKVIRGRLRGPKAESILEMANAIISEWEEAAGNG